MVLRRVILLLGIKKESFPSEIQKGLILEFLKENYSFLTVSEIKNALAEDYTEAPVFTTENTENMLVSGTEEIPEEETEGFFSKIFGF